MPSALHPYDGKERVFRDGDADPAEGLRLVAQLLRLAAPPPQGVRYELSFYSGGTGVFDRLAICLPVDVATRDQVVSALQGKTAGEAVTDEAWREDFLWLVGDEEPALPAQAPEALSRFINDGRKPYQPECRPGDSQWICRASDVNSWTVLWERDGVLSYLSFDQG